MVKIFLGGVYKLTDTREVRLLDQPTERTVTLIEQKSDGGPVRVVVGPEFVIPLVEFSNLEPKLLYVIDIASISTI